MKWDVMFPGAAKRSLGGWLTSQTQLCAGVMGVDGSQPLQDVSGLRGEPRAGTGLVANRVAGPRQARMALPVTSISYNGSRSLLEISKGDPRPDPPRFQKHAGGARLIYIG